MRLINTGTFKLEEFAENSIPPYAILSHTWGADVEELTFRDVENGKINKPGVGSTKFHGCCLQAKEDKLDYAWIDTCCIDKTNLVELSEAINSMFRWYNRASICYAYLADVPGDDNPTREGSKFRKSRWFRRGWTLQELLAPKHLRFYNSNWKYIGTKGTMCTTIMNITRVPRQFLLGITKLHTASVAQRMSWAAQRETKRSEDLAYCLLGIFDIAMPMIYGEGGEQAFFRLQEQIMKSTRDDSILAWGLNTKADKSIMSAEDQIIGGEILAAGPSYFENSGHIVVRKSTLNPLHSIDIVGGSLRIYLPLLTTSSGEIFGLLNCGPGSSPQQVVGIPLAKESLGASNEYARPRGCPAVLQLAAESNTTPELIHIKKDGQKDVRPSQQYWLYEEDLFAQINLALVDVEPSSCWDKQTNLISPISSGIGATSRILMRFRHSVTESQDFIMILEVKQPGSKTDPQFYTVICSRDTPLLELAEKYQHTSSKASRETSASNGVLHVSITLEPVDGGLIYINPEAMALPPNITIDASEEVKKSGLILEYSELLRESRQTKAEEGELNARSESYTDQLQLVREKREAIEHQQIELKARMTELEATRAAIEAEESDLSVEMCDLEEELAKIKKKRDDINERLGHAQKRLDISQHIDDVEYGRTLLRVAVDNGDAEVGKTLLTCAYDAAIINDDGWIPLIVASAKGNVDMVRQLLVTSEAEPDCKDSIFGRTTLSWASGRGHEAVVQLLLETGKVDVNSRDHDGWTPLHWAAERGYEDVIQLLLGIDSLDINARDNNGWTSTHLAAMGGHENVIQLLLDKGANDDRQRTLQGHRNWIFSVAFSHDSKFIASAGRSTIKIWETATDECCQTITTAERQMMVFSVAFSHDGKLIVSGSDRNNIQIWDVTTGQCRQTFQGHEREIYSVAFSHDSRLVVSGSADSTIKIWDCATGQCQQTLQGHTHFVWSVALSHDSKLVVSGSWDASIKIWDISTGQCRQTLNSHQGWVSSVAFSHDSKFIVSGSADKTIRIWDSITGECRQILRGHEGTVRSVALSHDSKLIASGSDDKAVKFWDVTTGECQRTFYGHDNYVASVAFSHDSKLIASGSKDKTIRIWASDM